VAYDDGLRNNHQQGHDVTERVHRPYHHGDLRRVVIETAAAMLSEEKGWQFTLREVARRAGVSHAAPYKHFPDKAALLAELAMRGFEQLEKEVRAAITPAPRSVRKEFLAAAGAYIDFGQTNPALYRLMFSADLGNPSAVHLSERAMSAIGVLYDLIDRGQRMQVFKSKQLQGQAAGSWALLHGITMLSIDGLLLSEKVGRNAHQAALTTLLEGLEIAVCPTCPPLADEPPARDAAGSRSRRKRVEP
jgi:AcrR family transcriptional regulator